MQFSIPYQPIVKGDTKACARPQGAVHAETSREMVPTEQRQNKLMLNQPKNRCFKGTSFQKGVA